MQKALEILKACREKGQKRAGGIDLYEAIAELEALQQTKQCNTCSFYHSYTGVCANDKCPLCADFVVADFGCIYHEAKGAMR